MSDRPHGKQEDREETPDGPVVYDPPRLPGAHEEWRGVMNIEGMVYSVAVVCSPDLTGAPPSTAAWFMRPKVHALGEWRDPPQGVGYAILARWAFHWKGRSERRR